jgi:hypothetical protein
MTARPSVNKRQRELQRKERQAEKLSRRDERRVRRNLVDAEPSETSPAPSPADDAGVAQPVLDSTPAK